MLLVKTRLLNSRPGWAFPDSAIDLDFVNGRYWGGAPDSLIYGTTKPFQITSGGLICNGSNLIITKGRLSTILCSRAMSCVVQGDPISGTLADSVTILASTIDTAKMLNIATDGLSFNEQWTGGFRNTNAVSSVASNSWKAGISVSPYSITANGTTTRTDGTTPGTFYPVCTIGSAYDGFRSIGATSHIKRITVWNYKLPDALLNTYTI